VYRPPRTPRYPRTAVPNPGALGSLGYTSDVPTYEYACTVCGQHVEVYQRFSEAPLTACGVCGGPLRKVFHPAGIVFKGSGFYATDSRSAAKSSTGDGEATSKKDGASKESSTKSKESPSKDDAGSSGNGAAASSAAKERTA
jgi:putative FmdB family regulatory protein